MASLEGMFGTIAAALTGRGAGDRRPARGPEIDPAQREQADAKRRQHYGATLGGLDRTVAMGIARKTLEAHLANRHQILVPASHDLKGLEQREVGLLIRGMIAAANADGGLEAGERKRIRDAIERSDVDEECRRVLTDSLENPVGVERLAKEIDGERLATRFYAVSLMAIDKRKKVNRAYLNYLALRLDLPHDAVVRMNREAGLPG